MGRLPFRDLQKDETMFAIAPFAPDAVLRSAAVLVGNGRVTVRIVGYRGGKQARNWPMTSSRQTTGHRSTRRH